ncbi:hypothetical protein ACLBXI_29690 [Bacillus cereus]
MRKTNLYKYVLGVTLTTFSLCISVPSISAADTRSTNAKQSFTNFATKSSIPVPQPVANENWFLGAQPDNVDYNIPPVVFIHGLHGYASEWWGGEQNV